MKNWIAALILATLPVSVVAQDMGKLVTAHVMPRLQTLAERTDALAQTARQECAATSPALRSTYGAAFDAWVAASHLRLGPSEDEDRAFALAFWPDPRGATPKTLSGLIADADPVALDPAAYREVSVAARGFYAMEFLLYDPAISTAGDENYRCQLVQTVAADIADIGNRQRTGDQPRNHEIGGSFRVRRAAGGGRG